MREEGRLKRQVAQATKMQAVGQLAGGVAHDFNNILTAIIGHCDLMLMRHTPGDSDYDDIQQIRTNSNRAAGLTRQLLAFSRQQTLRPQVLQLPDVDLGSVEPAQAAAGRDGRRSTSSTAATWAPVRADPGQLEQVVVNLAVNARDAMLATNPNGGGTLTIETLGGHRRRGPRDGRRRAAGRRLYRAARHATPAPASRPTSCRKIFEPFFTTKEVGKGTGLGLSTVYGIVKQSGGYIFAENRAGAGRGVHHLPAGPRRRGRAGRAAPPRAKAKPARDRGAPGTILLVEDEDMVRAVAERALTRQGYTVLTAENGEVALELLRRRASGPTC